jgi:hypothetical protein
MNSNDFDGDFFEQQHLFGFTIHFAILVVSNQARSFIWCNDSVISSRFRLFDQMFDVVSIQDFGGYFAISFSNCKYPKTHDLANS